MNIKTKLSYTHKKDNKGLNYIEVFVPKVVGGNVIVSTETVMLQYRFFSIPAFKFLIEDYKDVEIQKQIDTLEAKSMYILYEYWATNIGMRYQALPFFGRIVHGFFDEVYSTPEQVNPIFKLRVPYSDEVVRIKEMDELEATVKKTQEHLLGEWLKTL